MSFKRKLNKFIRSPGQFFSDSRILAKPISTQPLSAPDSSIDIKQSLSISSDRRLPKTLTLKSLEDRKISDIEKQPVIFGRIRLKSDGLIDLQLHDKKVINQSLGFSTLFICGVDNFLVNKLLISDMLKDRGFIAFREKSLYVLDTGFSMQHQNFSEKRINELFLHSIHLRQNKFSKFRSLVEINPTSIESILIRNTSPKIKFICVISNQMSFDFMKAYKDRIDVLVVAQKLDYAALSDVPRVICFSNRASLLSSVKMALIDCSFKSDLNYLIPVVTYQHDLVNIDKYNEQEHITGLLKIKYESRSYRTFKDLVLHNNTKIIELHLRENFYSLYKDLIYDACEDQSKLKALLLRTLKDGVFYEQI